MLASGSGTNVANFISYFKDHPTIEVALVVSNNPEALVLSKAAKEGVAHLVIRDDQWNDKDLVMGIFTESKIDYVVLAGFLLLVPAFMTEHYKDRIVNVHPALLPAYGGKGMYGMRIHRAVIDAGDVESGITIHHVNERYDEGEVICRYTLVVDKDETPETLARKVHQLEYDHYPEVVEKLVGLY